MTPAIITPRFVIPAIFLQIGTRRIEVDSYAQASELFCAARDAYGEGASKTPEALLVREDGTQIGHVSYNGRVWSGTISNWPNNALFYCPADINTIKNLN